MKTNIIITDTEESITRKSIEKDGVTKSIEVKKVVNGYIISICEQGYKKDKWYNNDQIYISKTNPLEEEGENSEEKEESFKETLQKALNNLKI